MLAALPGDAHARRVNLGFADAAALASTLERGLAAGLDVGDLVLLREYEAERSRAAIAAMAALHGLHTVFGAPGGVAGGLRAAGMGLLNALPPARRACVETAAGVGPLSWASTGSF